MRSGAAGTPLPFSATVPVAETQLLGASYGVGAAYGNNVRRAWGVTAGHGVAVALVDDGFTPAVVANFDSATSRSYGGGTIAEGLGTYPHGTTTSGLIGANGSGTGLVGVASQARIVGVKVAFGSTPFSQFVTALGYAAQTASVVNNSWGFTGFNPGAITDPEYAAWNAGIQQAVGNGRGGLGVSIVFAAGNDRSNGNTVAVQPVQNDPRVIAVAASDANGTVAAYSNSGPGLLVAAIGDNVAVPDSSGAAYYVSSGTSYAAPLVSGIVTMMLSVNPALGWRDIQEILASAAYAPAPSTAGFATDAATDWNGGGRHFSNDLGFGVVDASVAVDLARDWSARLTSANLQTATVAQSFPLRLGINTGAKSSVRVTAPLRVEHVQVHIEGDNLPLADTRIVLISPSGTRSVLLNDAGRVGGYDQSGGMEAEGDTITSNAFWGESASGAWTIQLTDSGGSAVGSISGWSLTVWGDAAASVATPLIYTPEFAALAAAKPARALVSNAGHATRTIDLVDLPGASRLDLNGGAGLIDGVAVQVAPGLTDLNAAGTTGSLVVTSAHAGGAILGGDGPTTVIGSGGADTVTAGAGTTVVYSGRDPAMTFFAGSGADSLFGGQGTATLVGGAAADTLVLINHKGGGRYSFADFTSGPDVVDAMGFSAASLTQSLAAQAPDGAGGTRVTLSDGSRIDFLGVSSVGGSAFGI